MKRSVLIIMQVMLAATAGWAGWMAGRSAEAADGAAVAAGEAAIKEAKTSSQRPPPAPEGWSRPSWPMFAQPDLSKENALARRAYDDPPAAVKEVMAQPAGPERNQAILSLLRGWVARDAVATAEWLASLNPAETPGMMLAEVGPVFESAPAEARAKGVLGFLAAKADRAILEEAAQGRSHARVLSAEDMRPSPEGNGFFTSGRVGGASFSDMLNYRAGSLATWAAQEPERALEWVRARPSAEARQWLMGTLVGALARHGAADQAIALYNEEPDLHEEGAVRSQGKEWAQADPTAALAWSEKIPDAGLRDAFISAALRGCPDGQAPELLDFTAQVSDAAARQALREHLIKSAAWNQAAVHEWLETDPSLDEAERGQWRSHLEKAALDAW